MSTDGSPTDRGSSNHNNAAGDLVEGFNPRAEAPKSLYVHVPFCRHRCGYCNFSLVAGRDHLIERFLKALQTEIGWLERSWTIETLFLGGGTPSHLPDASFAQLMKIIGSRFSLSEHAEITLECNPSDVTADKVALFSDCGFNRISLGVQSFDSRKLKRLERDHDVLQVHRAVEQIRQRIDNVSIDLIFATPGEDLALWKRELESAIALSPDHLSTYELTYEKGTQFWNRRQRGELQNTDEEICASMYQHTIERLAQANLKQYEVSSFAVHDRRCRHNLQYWNRQPWFAFGPGAARLIDGIRQINHRSTLQYMKRLESNRSPVAESNHLKGLDAAKEGLAIALRQIDGVHKSRFVDQFGLTVTEVLGQLKATLIEHKLAGETDDVFQLTRQGIMVCDQIAINILRE